MRLQVAALATALAVTWGPSSDGSIRLPDPIRPGRTGYEAGSSGAPQDASGDGIRLFLVRLQRVVQQSDAAVYNALLDESADGGRAARFIDTELMPGMTRAVIQERDRVPLEGRLPGDGFRTVVDVFQEYGDRARISTWWLDLTRNRDARAEGEWLIADQGRLTAVEDLYKLSLNPSKQFTAHNLEFRDEDLKLTGTGNRAESGQDFQRRGRDRDPIRRRLPPNQRWRLRSADFAPAARRQTRGSERLPGRGAHLS
jgi:hypothetical protein